MRNMPLKKIFTCTAILAAVCLGTIFWLAKHRQPLRKEPPAVTQPGPVIERHITYSFTLKNTTGQLIETPELWTYAPVKKTAFQTCINLQASYAYELITDRLGNQILHFTLSKLPPYATKTITINADLLMTDTPQKVDVKNLKPFLKPEKYIESDNPEILTLANTLKADNPAITAERTFQWVVSHITYSGFSGKNRGALFALENRSGDCTEFMYLYAALCRANSIAAQCIGGYVCTKNEILKPGSYHNWALIYQDNTWQVTDPQKRIFRQNASWFVAMRILGETSNNPMGSHHRFKFKGQGLKVKMNG